MALLAFVVPMTVYENLAFGLKLRKTPKKEMEELIENHLKLVSIGGMEKKYPSQLSGGQQQRVAIARSLLLKPSVLLLDEPFSALDAKIRQQMREELKKIQSELGITVVFVTHDLADDRPVPLLREALELAGQNPLLRINFDHKEPGLSVRLYQLLQKYNMERTSDGSISLLI